MPREVVTFRGSGEKVEPKRNKRDDDGGERRSSKIVNKAKKNISKKDADRRAGIKHA